jgi:hypothetical protein
VQQSKAGKCTKHDQATQRTETASHNQSTQITSHPIQIIQSYQFNQINQINQSVNQSPNQLIHHNSKIIVSLSRPLEEEDRDRNT